MRDSSGLNDAVLLIADSIVIDAHTQRVWLEGQVSCQVANFTV